MCIKATIVAFAFPLQCFENVTIVAYAGLNDNYTYIATCIICTYMQYTYIHTCIHMYIDTYIHTPIYTNACIHNVCIYVQRYVCMYVSVYVCLYLCNTLTP